MIRQLQKWALQSGFRLACGDIRVLGETRGDLTRLRDTGEINEDFYAANLAFFRYGQSAQTIGDLKALIMVAMSRPAHRLTFQLQNGPLEVLLPPTYVRYSAVFEDIRNDLCSAIPALRGHLECVLAPLKSLACRLGLAVYGRNNLTYIPDWGSYYQLLGYVTDLDLGLPTDWQPAPIRLMDDCERCGICASVCPTGAIGDDRVLLHAELCTTLFSEQSGDLRHELSPDCLFGCLECQLSCPANRDLLRIERAGVSFDRGETEAVLAGDGNGASAHAITAARKLASLGLTEEPLVSRNLARLAAVHEAGAVASSSGWSHRK